jgi:hypothetical protein
MLEWLISEVVGWGVGLLGLAIIYPIYKAGFFVRQGLIYKKGLTEINKKLSAGNTLTAEGEKAYGDAARKSSVMLMGAPAFLFLIFILLLVFVGWWTAGLSVALAVFGFFNVDN